MQNECWDQTQSVFAMGKYDRLGLKKLPAPALATARQKAFWNCLMTKYVNKLFWSRPNQRPPLPSRQQKRLGISAQLYELFKCSFQFGLCM